MPATMSRPRFFRWLLESRSRSWLMSQKGWATHFWMRLLISWALTPGQSLTKLWNLLCTRLRRYQTFMTDRLVEKTTSIAEHIKTTQVVTFKSTLSKRVSSLKSDCCLFSRLYIACLLRDGNLSNMKIRRVSQLYLTLASSDQEPRQISGAA